VILVDANLLIYANVSGFAQHNTARQWLERVLNQGPRVGLPWPSLLAFVRLSSNPRLFTRPQSIGEAWLKVEEWLNVAGVWIPIPGDHHREILRGLLRVAGVQSNNVPDAHLAALAIEHGLTLCSSDSGFRRFPNLRWENPIAG
jgi:toxin-antitoxin system PIN domain toxin